ALQIAPSDQLQAELERWWLELETQVPFRQVASYDAYRPDVPETVYQSVQMIWDNAIKDARLELELQASQTPDTTRNENGLSSEDELYLSRSQIVALEDSNQRMRSQLAESETNLKNLEAERAMLRTKLQSIETKASDLERLLAQARGEAEQAADSRDEAKKQLDQRMKEEILHHQESLHKMENKVSYYRHQLDKLRDEWGKKENAMNSRIQDMQAQIARNDVSIDTQVRQIRSQDEELKRFRGEIANQSRNMSASNTQILASSNRLKRLEDDLQQRDANIKEAKQRALIDKADFTRRETELRGLLKDKEAGLNLTTGKVNELQRVLIARDEEIRRLTAKL
ncbi:MAG: hypothetical protein QF872_09380, partial [Gammaproteobacteria bacterium]|nr:hypothetical protein [Gammaproteobacteria bacterium]